MKLVVGADLPENPSPTLENVGGEGPLLLQSLEDPKKPGTEVKRRSGPPQTPKRPLTGRRRRPRSALEDFNSKLQPESEGC